jgi:hypothetical protein
LRTRKATSQLAGIAQQIEQNLLEPHGVRVERAQVLLGLDDEAVLVLLGELSRGADDLVDKPGNINRFGIEFELAGFDLREVEHLVDEAKEMGPGGIHTAQRLQRLFRAEARRVGDHHLGQADDGVERRAHPACSAFPVSAATCGNWRNPRMRAELMIAQHTLALATP